MDKEIFKKFKEADERKKNMKLELLNGTVVYYQENPRATTTHGCRYIMDDGRKCAAGRLFSDEALEEIQCLGLNGNRLSHIIRAFADKDIQLFKDNYQWVMGESSFMRRLQHFHDSLDNWDNNGNLTERGKKDAEDIEENIKEGNI